MLVLFNIAVILLFTGICYLVDTPVAICESPTAFLMGFCIYFIMMQNTWVSSALYWKKSNLTAGLHIHFHWIPRLLYAIKHILWIIVLSVCGSILIIAILITQLIPLNSVMILYILSYYILFSIQWIVLQSIYEIEAKDTHIMQRILYIGFGLFAFSFQWVFLETFFRLINPSLLFFIQIGLSPLTTLVILTLSVILLVLFVRIIIQLKK